MTITPSWLHDAIRNFEFRLKLPESKRTELDGCILALNDGGLSSKEELNIFNKIEEILNTGVEPQPARKAIADAARRGFES